MTRLKGTSENEDGTSTYPTPQEWLRAEWKRTGLPWAETNKACGVKAAAVRKYFTKDHLWYFPPGEVFEKLVRYANTHGAVKGTADRLVKNKIFVRTKPATYTKRKII